MTGRVLQVVTTTDRRGAEVFAVELGSAMTEQGFDVETVALVTGHVGGVDVPVMGSRRLAPTTMWALRRRVREANIVIGHGSTTLFAGSFVARTARTPFVYRNVGSPLYWAPTRLRRARVAAALRSSRRVVALWEGSARELVQQFGVPEHKIVVIPRGVPSARYPEVSAERREEARRSIGIPTDAPVVATVGSLSPEKNVSLAIDAVVGLEDAWHLVIGDGPDRAELESFAAGRGARTVFTGRIDDTAQMLAAADVLLLSSATEGIPGVVIEAGLMALPVVATDVGGVRTVVVDGETGLVVPPDDREAMVEALGRALVNGMLGPRARRRCLERFELSVVARAWGVVVREVLDANGW